MSDNPLTNSMDKAEQEQEQAHDQETEPTTQNEELEEFLEQLDQDKKRTETIGIGVTPQMLATWKELQKPQSKGGTDADVIQQIRDQMVKLAHRNQNAARRAMMKYKIDNEYDDNDNS